MFMGANYLITVHQEPIDELEEVAHRWQQQRERHHRARRTSPPRHGAAPPAAQRHGSDGADRPHRGPIPASVFCSTPLLDTIVDNYFPVIDGYRGSGGDARRADL